MIDNESYSALASNDTTPYSSSFAYAQMTPEQKVQMAFDQEMQQKLQEQIAADDVAARIAEVEQMLKDMKNKQ